MIIDMHTHTFPDRIAKDTIRKLSAYYRIQPYSDGTEQALSVSRKKAGIDFCVSLPVLTNPAQTVKVNDGILRRKEELFSQGILSFGGIHPDYEDYRGMLRLLKNEGIPGIKIHPISQNTPLDDIRYMRILDEASSLGLYVITHTGMDTRIEANCLCSVPMILHVLDTVRPTGLILAHMGCLGFWPEVESDLAGAPVWFDTAFSIGCIRPLPQPGLPLPPVSNMSDSAFVRLARKHGTERILFGTDSPWEDLTEYLSWFRQLPFTTAETERILYQNACRLLALPC